MTEGEAKRKGTKRAASPSTPEGKPTKAPKPPARRPPAPRKKATGAAAGGTLKLRLSRSPIGYSKRQKAIVAGLGLRHIRQVVERQDTPEIRGMVAKVAHLVDVVAP